MWELQKQGGIEHMVTFRFLFRSKYKSILYFPSVCVFTATSTSKYCSIQTQKGKKNIEHFLEYPIGCLQGRPCSTSVYYAFAVYKMQGTRRLCMPLVNAYMKCLYIRLYVCCKDMICSINIVKQIYLSSTATNC